MRRLDGDVERELATGADEVSPQPAQTAVSQAVARELERRAELATRECPGNARRTGAWLRAMATSRERGVRRAVA